MLRRQIFLIDRKEREVSVTLYADQELGGKEVLQHQQETLSPLFLLLVRQTPEASCHEVLSGHLRHDDVRDVAIWKGTFGPLGTTFSVQ